MRSLFCQLWNWASDRTPRKEKVEMTIFLLAVIALGVLAILAHTGKVSDYHCPTCFSAIDSRATICRSCRTPIDPAEIMRQYNVMIRRDFWSSVTWAIIIVIVLVIITSI